MTQPETTRRTINDIATAARDIEQRLTHLATLLAELTSNGTQKSAVNYHELLDARSGLGAAQRGISTIESFAVKWGAE